jgi:hypothetical protein
MFRAFKKACKSGNEKQIMNTLMRWLDYYGPDKPVAILSHYLDAAGNPDLTKILDSLQRKLYYGTDLHNPKIQSLYVLIQKIRKKGRC